MALNSYLTQVQRLLHDSTGSLYPTADLTSYINQGRLQIASEGMCVRGLFSLNTAAATQVYAFSSISVSALAGASYVLAVRKAGIGTVSLASRVWDWFYNYCILAPATGSPNTWSQLGQGASGNLYLYPTPTSTLTMTLDCVVVPVVLVDDTTVEVLPYPWTDAVQYFAAYMAYFNSQRTADADRMWQEYQKYMQRARDMSTPTALPRNYTISNQPSGVPSQSAAIFPGGKNA
jgi:hypothetical protein